MHAIPAPAAHPVRLPFYRQLYFQVVFAIVLGILLGHFEPAYGEALKPLGDAFIKLVKMIIAPVIFLTIVTGISGMSQLSSVGRVFGKAMAYFLFFSTLALVIGMVVANVVQPGAGMNINPADLDQTAVKSYVAKSHEMTLTGFAMDIIPKTLMSPFVGDNILQVLLVAVLFGVGLAMVGEAGRPVSEPIRNTLDIDAEAQIVSLIVHKPETQLLLASSAGKGFAAVTDELLAETRKGRQVVNLKPGQKLVVARPIAPEHDHVAVVGDNRKLVIFHLEELPVMTRGQGVTLQRYRDGGLSDATTLKLDEGLSWQMGGESGRTRTEDDARQWKVARGAAGRLPPRGFPKDNRF